MGLFGGGGNIARRAGEQAAKDITFLPIGLDVAGVGAVDVQPGAGTNNFGINLRLPEEVRAIQRTLFGQAPGALAGAGALIGPQAEAGQALFGAGTRALGALDAFDPLQAAATQFERLEGVLSPIRERETAGLEARLARQGILTGTAGERRLGERAAAIERERQLGLLNQFQAAQQAQRNLADLGIGLTGAGGATRQALFGTGVAAPAAAQELAQPVQNLLGTSAALGQARMQGQIARAQAIQQHNQMMSARGGGGFGGGLVSGLAGSFLGPAASALGGSLAGQVGGLFGLGAGPTAAPPGSVGAGVAGPIGMGGGGLFG